MFVRGFEKTADALSAPGPSSATPATPAPSDGAEKPERTPQVPRPFIGSIGPGIIAGTAQAPIVRTYVNLVRRRKKKKKTKKKR
jgi:hypothetical protein